MNWTFHPQNSELTTSLPLSVEVREWEGRPKVILQGVGELELKAAGKGVLKADFHLTLPGTYSVEIKDDQSAHLHEFKVTQYKYLDFTNEFGFFLVLFLIFMGGIILWVRQIMKKKTLLT